MQVDSTTPVRCLHPSATARLAGVVEQARAAGDSVGGSITCVCRGVPAGWGEPVFDKLEAMLGHAMLSIPSTKVGFCVETVERERDRDRDRDRQRQRGCVCVCVCVCVCDSVTERQCVSVA